MSNRYSNVYGRITHSQNWRCQFHQTVTSFPDYIISNTGMAMDPAKVKAIIDWPRPTALKAIQRFPGFANYYRRFIQNFSFVIAPITALTQKGTDPALWSPAATHAFEKLKTAFVSAPVLVHPDPGLPFTLEVDASDVGA
ncbi:uncharacterized protein LOC142490754 [Ascaphus truei]|uniref:uncharacterized protein LOC142490754 n=1 Tax=Ascaphus truei TaxID=8439 RepID=UPI003F5968AF